MFQRMVGVLKLDVNTYEEIEHDQNETGQAALIVLIVAIVSGIGNGLFTNFASSFGALSGNFISNFISAVIYTFGGVQARIVRKR